MDKNIPTIRLHLWLDTDEGVYFGMGSAMLLEKIEEHGSLKKAAEDLGMSYRAAWGKVKKSEEILGIKLIEQGASKREGYRLTEEGRTIMRAFLRWFAEVEQDALKRAVDLFPWPVRSYNSPNKG